MKRKDSRRRIRIFYGILIIPTLLWLVLSVVGIAKHLDFDTGEKRNKHELAEDTDLSNLTAELEAVYNDRVPFRSVMLSVNSTMNWILELPYTKVIEPALIRMANHSMEKNAANQTAMNNEGGTAGQNGNPATGMQQPSADMQPSAAATQDSAAGDPSVSQENMEGMEAVQDPAAGNEEPAGSEGNGEANGDPSGDAASLPVLPPYYESPMEAGYYPYKELAAEVIQGRDNWLFTSESYADFTGDNMPSQETLAYKLGRMELLNQLCQNRGIRLHIVAMPNKASVYPEYMPSVDQVPVSAVNVLEEYVHANSSVSFNYLDDAMLGAKIYGQLYYKHDTHWNNRGGLAASAYMRNIFGLPPIDIGSVSYGELDPYYGDLAIYSGLPAASFDLENAVEMYYKPDVPQQLVRGGDDYIDEVISQNTEREQTLVMVGDSYRHALLPYLSRDFAHVYSVSEVKLNPEVADILAGADIILLEGVERNFFSKTYYDETVEELIALLS